MTINGNRLWLRRLVVSSICVLISGWLGAQAGAGSETSRAKSGTPAATASPGRGADASASKPHNDSYVIGNDDVLAVNVWKEPDISRAVPVRSDGKISLPLAGEMQAAGKTPLQLERDIATKLKDYVSEPEVTVIVQEIRSQKFNVLGQVVRPGSYLLAEAATVLDAIALAGGFRDFAKQKSIYILRQNPDGGESRIPFNYKDVIKGKNSAQNIRLQPRDTIVVP
jgi:polysaccharide export outer membrane protein